MPTVACHRPARSRADLLRQVPRAARISAQVSSAVACGPPAPPALTTMPRAASGVEVEVAGVAAGLADQPHRRQPLDHLARQRRALLEQHDRVEAVEPLDEGVTGHRVGERHDLVVPQPRAHASVRNASA